MTELERRLQEAALDESAAYQPSADLPERIGHRMRSRRRRTQALAASGALAAVALLAVAVAQLPGDDQQGVVVANDPSSTTTTTTVPTTTTTVPTTSTTASTTTTTVVPPPTIDASTPLNPKGIGPIEAGMTVAEAESASGLSVVTAPDAADGWNCYYIELEGQPDLSIRVTSPDGLNPAPMRDGVIQAITIYEAKLGGPWDRTTTAGIGLGSTEADVRAVHGDAVEEQPHVYDPEGAYLYVHPDETPGFGFRYVLDGRGVVTEIDVGFADAITAPEGCA